MTSRSEATRQKFIANDEWRWVYLACAGSGATFLVRVDHTAAKIGAAAILVSALTVYVFSRRAGVVLDRDGVVVRQLPFGSPTTRLSWHDISEFSSGSGDSNGRIVTVDGGAVAVPSVKRLDSLADEIRRRTASNE